jgi:hypothetical protein
MRPDVNTCRDPDLLAAEVRRLNAVIAAGESARLSQKCDCPAADNSEGQDKLTDEEREAFRLAAEWCRTYGGAVYDAGHAIDRFLKRTK